MGPAREPPTERTRVRRIPELASYDPAVVHAVLDAGLIAHVGVVADDGDPVVLPMTYGRLGDNVYIHGSVASRLMRLVCGGAPAAVTVTIVDGIVLARSAFETTMNYRCVTVLGRGRRVDDEGERLAALESVMERLVPGHWPNVRAPAAAELRQVLVAAVALDEASAKVRSGPPEDPPADHGLPHWAGEIPLHLAAGHAHADPTLRSGITPPESVRGFVRRFGG